MRNSNLYALILVSTLALSIRQLSTGFRGNLINVTLMYDKH
jgi:hypothetical protein